MFGKELILDLHNCDISKFNRKDIKKYLILLCKLIKMKREKLHWWDYANHPEEYKKAPAHLKGTSVVQFIKTSTIVIHTLEVKKKVFINIFSCKDFDEPSALSFSRDFFGGELKYYKAINRE